MQKIRLAIFMAAICLILPLAAGAAANIPMANPTIKVYDFAGILSENEEAALASAIDSAIAASGADFAVLTVEDDLGLGMVEYSDEFYEHGGFNMDKGVMLYVNMVERDVYFATYGSAVGMFSSGDIDSLLDRVAPLLSQGQYYAACTGFIDLALAHMNRDTGIGIGGMLLASLLAGVAVSLILLMLHSRSLPRRPNISAYFSGSGFTLTNSRDDFLFTNTTRIPIPQQSSSGGGSGGGAHRTSGGRSAGGGGRKF